MEFTHSRLSTEIITKSQLPITARSDVRATVYQTATHVPPSRFLTAPMAYSSLSLASLLHLASGHGVRPVSFVSAPDTYMPGVPIKIPSAQGYDPPKNPTCQQRLTSPQVLPS